MNRSGSAKARMEIVNRNPDRVKALASAFSIDETMRDKRLKMTHWIIDQLLEIDYEADAVLGRYATEIEQRFPDVPSVTTICRESDSARSGA